MKKPVDYLTTLDDLKYGILLSGGLDSAVLLGLIATLSPSVNIQPFTMMKSDESYKYVDAIIDEINSRMGTNIPHSIMIADPGGMFHRSYGSYTTGFIFNAYPEIDFLFNGVTQNPDELTGYNGAPDRAKEKDHPKVVMPFVHHTKETVVELMFDHHLDWLSDYTHTCTRNTKGRCGVCFQCQERKFAYIMNNKVDTGVL